VKVILLKNVENLGKEGEIKEVAEGYARNFLIPKKLGQMANNQNIQEAEAKKSKQAKNEQMELEETQKLAEQLDGRELYIKVKEKNGTLFGSVNEKTIAKTFADEGTKIDPSCVKLDESIKEVGDYDVRLELPHGLEASIKVILVPEEV
jgi:large subunit ribosomal protein L9